MKDEQLYELRKILKEGLASYDGKEKIKLNVSTDILGELIFNYQQDKDNEDCIYKSFAIKLDLIKKLDLSDVSFDNVNVEFIDFTGSKGVKINPQTVKGKSLFSATCNNVEFTGPFDGANVFRTNFTGSKGAKINPQTIKGKSLCCNINDVEFIGPFDEINVENIDFTRSKGAKINPQTITDKSLYNTVCYGVEFMGPFDGVNVCKCDFTGSTGAIINPQKVYNRCLNYAKLTDTKLIYLLAGVEQEGTDFDGCKRLKCGKEYEQDAQYDKTDKELIKVFKK